MIEHISGIQEDLLSLAKRISEICDKHGIKYSLEGGSLLGAVRHHGFIPWDNDFDFLMTRENYDLFMEVIQAELGDNYKVYSYDKDRNYPFSFSKICIKNRPIEYKNQKFSFPTLLHIDVFPFDYVPSSIIKQRIQKYKAVFYKRMLIIHDGGEPEVTASKIEKLLFLIVKPISLLYTHNSLVQKSERNLRSYAKTNQMALMMGVYGYDKTKMDTTDLNTYMYLDFEDTSFMCLKHYKKYLTKLDGDYMELPPENKRRGHDFVLTQSRSVRDKTE